MNSIVVWILLFSCATTRDISANPVDSCAKRKVSTSAVVNTTSGVITGQSLCSPDGRPFQQFLGVRYAKPPTGNLRSKAPQFADYESGISDGTGRGILTACPQVLNVTYRDLPCLGSPYRLEPSEVQLSEDCLHFNIYRPLTPVTTADNGNSPLLPVLIFFHGGSFSQNSNMNEVFNGSQLAVQTNTIVAVPNYRTGILGFLRLDNFTPKTDQETDLPKGNQGLLDQALAIRWMRENAQSFGGNPDEITIFGSSAGAASVQYHLLSNVSRGLFSRASMMGGLAATDYSYQPPAAAANGWRQCIRAIIASSSDLNTINAMTDRDLLHFVQSQNWQHLYAGVTKLQTSANTSTLCQPSPTTDGLFIGEGNTPKDLIDGGKFRNSTALIGMTSQEALNLLPFILGREVMQQMPNVQLSEQLFKIALQMLSVSPSNSTEANAEMFAFANKNGTTRWLALVSATNQYYADVLNHTLTAYKRQNIPVYRYEFGHPPSVPTYGYSLKSYGAAGHFDEMPFWFGLPLNPKYGFTAKEADLSRKMVNALGNFARTGNPTSGVAESWSPHNDNSSVLEFV